MPFEVLYLYILLVRPRKLIARCAILSHEPKITEVALVSSPPRSPPSEGFHLATTLLVFRLCFEYHTFLQKVFSMTKTGRFLRGFFTCRFSAVGFLCPLKSFKTQRQKSCSRISLIFIGKAMHFYGLISRLVVLLIKGEMHRSNVQLL